jgi:hypothetical protein
VIKFWQLYPKFIRDLFTKAFTKEAMHGKQPRLTGSEWQIAFTQIRDMLITCPCGGETFFDTSEDSAICIYCGAKIPRPSIMSVHKYKIVLFPGQKIYRCHVDNNSDDFREICGEVIRNPDKPQIWGLKNLSPAAWETTNTEGVNKTISKGEVLVIAKTKNINLGNCIATIS